MMDYLDSNMETSYITRPVLMLEQSKANTLQIFIWKECQFKLLEDVKGFTDEFTTTGVDWIHHLTVKSIHFCRSAHFLLHIFMPLFTQVSSLLHPDLLLLTDQSGFIISYLYRAFYCTC